MTRRLSRVRIKRDLVLLVAGLGLLGHQALVVAQAQAALVAAALALIGYPFAARADDRLKDRQDADQVTRREDANRERDN